MTQFDSIKGLRDYLSGSPQNTPDTAYTVRLDIGDITGLDGILKTAGRYVSLDLSGSTITAIPEGAFCYGENTDYEGNDFLVGIALPDRVTSISDFAFALCGSLASVTIPDSVTRIGDSAFSDCTSLASVTIPDSVTHIGNEAFWGCSLERVIIPGSVTDLGDEAFASCVILADVTIPDSIVSIGDGAFEDCESLASVTIPRGVAGIREWAFCGCTGLTSVTFLGAIALDGFHYDAFAGLGDLRAKYFAEGGGAGTYTTEAPVGKDSAWTKMGNGE